MISRADCLYNGKIINISSIYTVVNGKQINIPGRVEQLRALGRSGQLLCPCGCGGQLILVAGQRGLRTQHFRMKSGTGTRECHAHGETEESIQAKIVLRCWLVDQLGTESIAYAVPVAAADRNSSRKFEFTFLARQKRLGLIYWRLEANVRDDKTDYLSSTPEADHIIYVISRTDPVDNGQYPEFFIKLQRAQGYCLFLQANSDQYDEAHLYSCRYVQNRFGEWQMLRVTGGLLHNYRIGPDGFVYPPTGGRTLKELAEDAENKYLQKQTVLAQKEQETNRRRQQEQEEREKLHQEYLHQQQILEQKRKQKAAEEAARKAELREKREEALAQKEALEQAARKKAEADDHLRVLTLLNQNTEPAIDMHGRRWIRCKYCGKTATDDAFVLYGGPYGVNGGICYDCSRSGKVKESEPPHPATQQKKSIRHNDPSICPVCGGRLRTINGRYGKFIGCSNYPRCQYRRKLT